jgi:hypothetical protein
MSTGHATQDTISLEILTTDTAWIAANAETGPEQGTAIVTIPASDAEQVIFGGQYMVSFDLGKIAKRIPADWMNRHAMVPLRHLIAGTVPERSATGRTATEDRNRRALQLFAGGTPMADAEAQAAREMA